MQKRKVQANPAGGLRQKVARVANSTAATPKGKKSPKYKHGLYSKYVHTELRSVLDELQEQPSEELISPGNEIRLMQALIASAETLGEVHTDLKDLDLISKIIDRLISAKQRSQSIMIEQQRLVPASDVKEFLFWMETQLVEKIGEVQAGEVIENLQTFKLTD